MISIYTLLLENNKYYVGQTKNIDQRFSFHLKGKLSSDWTKKYKPIKIIEVFERHFTSTKEAMNFENKITIQYMKKFGWRNVRGGDFCTLDEEKLRFLLILNSDIEDDLLPIKTSFDLSSFDKVNCFFVLKLEKGNFFIGRTNNIRIAILNEINGLGSGWTKLHKPCELIAIIKIQSTDKSTVRKLHNKLVIEYMKNEGFQKIRGGDFYQVDVRNHKNKVLNYTDIFANQ